MPYTRRLADLLAKPKRRPRVLVTQDGTLIALGEPMALDVGTVERTPRCALPTTFDGALPTPDNRKEPR